MARVVVPPEARDGDGFVVQGEPFRHAVNVLRTRSGDRLVVVDGTGVEFDCVADEVTSRQLIARIVGMRALGGATHFALRLYCALLKGDKLDLVLQKGTEVGVEEFGLFRAARAAVRVAVDDEPVRRGRWRRIVQAAVGQCGRPSIPRVQGVLSFDEMVGEAVTADLALIPWEGDGTETLPRFSDVLRARPDARSAAVVVGPEGGFTRDEIDAARTRGMVAVTLGERILRAETAALVVPALVLAAYGELG